MAIPRIPDISIIISKVVSDFRSLSGSPPELKSAYTLKFLDSFAYFSFSIIFTLFLSSEFGFSDYHAGTLYGAWGALVTLFGLANGVIIDNLGVAFCLRIGFVLSLVARILIFSTTSRVTLCLAMVVMSFGNSLGIPVLTVGIRRYTTEANRGFAFGLFYVIMNVAALLSGPVVDYCTILYKEDDKGGRYLDQGQGYEAQEWSLTGYRLVVLLGIFSNIVACFVSFRVKEIKVGNTQNGTQEFQPVKGNAIDILRETMRSPNFWRFLVVCLVTMNVRMIFRHLDATLPKYMVREFGDDVPKGTIYSINPALIMILVPIVTAATTHVDPLIMIHHGSYISTASVFFLVASTSIPACVLFVIFLSIGEAIWSPRLYDYTMQIAKEGREGTYMALSSAPLFLAKLPVGMMSGYLLEKYCPEDGPRDSQKMWLIIGLTTAVSPILLTVLWKYISQVDDETSYEEINRTDSRDVNEGTELKLVNSD